MCIRDRLIVLVILFYLTWNTKIAYPFVVITTFLHEISHALAFVMTGGTVLEFNVHADGSGTVPGYDGSLFFIFSSGYVGRAFSEAYSICWPRGQIGTVGYWASLASAFWR